VARLVAWGPPKVTDKHPTSLIDSPKAADDHPGHW